MPTKKPDTRKGDRGKTKMRSFRCADEMWDAVLEKAQAEAGHELTTSDAARWAFAAYIGDPSITGLAGSEMDRRSSAYQAKADG